jgi:hypothetical protein
VFLLSIGRVARNSVDTNSMPPNYSAAPQNEEATVVAWVEGRTCPSDSAQGNGCAISSLDSLRRQIGGAAQLEMTRSLVGAAQQSNLLSHQVQTRALRSTLRFVAIRWARSGRIGHIVGSADGPGLVPQGILVDVTGT